MRTQILDWRKRFEKLRKLADFQEIPENVRFTITANKYNINFNLKFQKIIQEIFMMKPFKAQNFLN